MNDDERTPGQESLHDKLVEALELDEGEVLTGWIVAYETRTGDEEFAGHFYGPDSMTSWHALGLLEWARTVSVPRSLDDNDEEDE
jgi:hypothetical protein